MITNFIIIKVLLLIDHFLVLFPLETKYYFTKSFAQVTFRLHYILDFFVCLWTIVNMDEEYDVD